MNNISLFQIIVSHIFVMPLLALGNPHVFPEDRMISKLDISCFSNNCIYDRGSHPTMSFSDDGKHFAVWDDEYVGIYELKTKDAKPSQRLALVKKHPWGNIYRGRCEQAISDFSGNIVFDGTARKYIPLLYSSFLFPDNFQMLKHYIIKNENLMKKYNFLLHEKALCLQILGGYKSSPETQPLLLGSINFKAITSFGQTNFSFKDPEYGASSNSMLSSDMTRACISSSVPEAIFSFYQGKQKVIDITPKLLRLEHRGWQTSTSSLSDDGTLLAVIFTYAGRFTAPWNFRTAIAFVDTENKKIKNIIKLSGIHKITFCFSNDKSKVALWENGKKAISIYYL